MDWVTARFRCVTATVFVRLGEQVGSDLSIYKNTNNADPVDVDVTSSRIVVDRNTAIRPFGNDRRACYGELLLGVNEIHLARGQEKTVFIPTVDDAGACKLRGPDGKLYDLWQVSRMLLEPILFL